MQSGKIHSRKIEKGDMAGKDDLLSFNCSIGGGQSVFLHRLDRGMLVDGQLVGYGFQKF